MGGILYLVLALFINTKQIGGAIKFSDSSLYEGSSCQLKNGQNGVCRPSCADPEVRRDSSSICSFDRRGPIICCPGTSLQNVEGSSNSYPTLERVCSEQKEEQERKRKQREEWFERCKVQVCTTPARVPSAQNENTHMAVLGWNTPSNLTDWKCGGSLIHPAFVLTAAHCVQPLGQPNVVRIGGINLEDDMYDYFVVDFDVVTSYIHPQYSVSEYYNDIALLQVIRTENHRLSPIPNRACLWLRNELPEQRLLAMGYGAPAFGQTFTYKLYQNTLTVIETDMCKKYYTATDGLPRGLVDSIICAYDPDGLADTCEGDSGGPMLYTEKDWMKTPYVVAVISFGTVCRSGDPGAYTRVYSYLSWIEEVISQNVTT